MRRIIAIEWLLLCIVMLGCETAEKVEVSSEQGWGSLNKKAPPETLQYGQLVGDWECVIKSFRSDTVVGQTTAHWSFRYILDGFAIQDFWTNPTEPPDGIQQILGTNIRIYNKGLKKWQCAWVENQTSSISGIWLSHEDDNGHLLLYDETGSWEIEFYNIGKEKFDWKWRVKDAAGDMQTTATIIAKRI